MTRPTILSLARDLARPGIDPPSPAWAATLGLWYGLPLDAADVDTLVRATGRSRAWLESRASGGQPFRELWARVGRRGRKSSVAALIAVYEALFGGHERHLMPGERGLVACISHSAAGSAVVARFARTYLDALGIAHDSSRVGSLPLVQIEGAAFDLAIFPASQTAPRGWPIPVVVLDELAHLPTDDGTGEEYVNSDTAIISAIRPAQAQFPSAKLIAISTPLARQGVFHETVEAALGSDDPAVLAVQGPTWEWSPDVTEARTRELERDDDIWAREYLAQPSATEGLAFHADHFSAAMGGPLPEGAYSPGPGFLTVDASKLRSGSDGFAYAFMRWMFPVGRSYTRETGEVEQHVERLNNGRTIITRQRVKETITLPPDPVLDVFNIGAFRGDQWASARQEDVIAHLAGHAARYGIAEAFGDDFESRGVSDAFNRAGMTFTPYSFSLPQKDDAIITLRRMMRERSIRIAPNEQLRRQALGLTYRMTSSGRAQYMTHGKDELSCLIVAGIALNDGRLSWQPGKFIAPQR